MANKVMAIIEMGKDGLYSAHSDFEINGYSFGGFGDSAKMAKEDFLSSIKEAVEMMNEELQTELSAEDFEVEWSYDIPSLFGCFEYLNISKFALVAGINASKMRQYARGIAFPSEKTVEKIANAITIISKDLATIKL